jgi:hypothetical protein
VERPPLHCDRCARELHPGEGGFYVVKLEAFADPYPPVLSGPILPPDLEAEIGRLTDEAAQLDEQELMDQVYRRRVLVLCTPCYRPWIANPVG